VSRLKKNKQKTKKKSVNARAARGGGKITCPSQLKRGRGQKHSRGGGGDGPTGAGGETEGVEVVKETAITGPVTDIHSKQGWRGHSRSVSLECRVEKGTKKGGRRSNVACKHEGEVVASGREKTRCDGMKAGLETKNTKRSVLVEEKRMNHPKSGGGGTKE